MIEKYLEGSVCILIEVAHLNLVGVNEGNYEKPQSGQQVSRPRFEPSTSTSTVNPR
jgi:hypothetical protein